MCLKHITKHTIKRKPVTRVQVCPQVCPQQSDGTAESQQSTYTSAHQDSRCRMPCHTLVSMHVCTYLISINQSHSQSQSLPSALREQQSLPCSTASSTTHCRQSAEGQHHQQSHKQQQHHRRPASQIQSRQGESNRSSGSCWQT